MTNTLKHLQDEIQKYSLDDPKPDQGRPLLDFKSNAPNTSSQDKLVSAASQLDLLMKGTLRDHAGRGAQDSQRLRHPNSSQMLAMYDSRSNSIPNQRLIKQSNLIEQNLTRNKNNKN